MTKAEMIEKAEIIRQRDKFGTMTPDEIEALPGTEAKLEISHLGYTIPVYEIRPRRSLPNPVPLILNFHGGGFIKGRSDRDRRYCCFLADALNCIVWDVDYSLAPEHPFPTAVNETYAVLEYAAANASSLGIRQDQIAVSGHSAGGALVAAALIIAGRTGSFRPCCALMEYLPCDMSDAVQKLSPKLREDPFWVKRAGVENEYTAYYLREESDCLNPLCAPGLASDAELACFPPCLIISAEIDTRQAETEQFAARLVGLGVPVTACRVSGAMHGFSVNRTPGWEKALQLHQRFFQVFL